MQPPSTNIIAQIKEKRCYFGVTLSISEAEIGILTDLLLLCQSDCISDGICDIADRAVHCTSSTWQVKYTLGFPSGSTFPFVLYKIFAIKNLLHSAYRPRELSK